MNKILVVAFLVFVAQVFPHKLLSQSVDPLTGRLQYSIPIWQISQGDLSVPISIVYSGGGVRVEESEGTAGMSWNLVAEGSIGREVRGLPDDYKGAGTDQRRGWLFNNLAQAITNFTPQADDNLADCTDEQADYNFINGHGYLNDAEPDLFYINAPGLNGQFVFGVDGLAKTIPYQDLKFEVLRDLTTEVINEIKITNNLGYVYTFNVKIGASKNCFRSDNTLPVTHFKTEWNQYNTKLSYTSAWKLSRIVSPKGAEIIFAYTEPMDSYSVRKVITIDEAGVEKEQYKVREEVANKIITSISTGISAFTANFNWEGGRIGSIEITSAHSDKEKKINFVYENIRDYRETIFSYGRAFLKQISEEDDCITAPSHEFVYNGVNFETRHTAIPFEDKNLQDLWGYYNGIGDTLNLPTIYVYNAYTGAERFRYTQVQGQAPDQVLSGADRSANPSVVATGSLSEVKLPTGASTKFFYESNYYIDATTGQNVAGGGVRVSKIRNNAAEKGSEPVETLYEYTNENSLSSGKLIYPPVYAFAGGDFIYRSPTNLAPDGGIVYTRTTIKQTGKGKTVYEFLVPGVYPQTSFSDWSASKTFISRAQGTCNVVGNLRTGYYAYPFAPSTNYDFERGLIDKVRDYAENGTLVQERTFNYARLNTNTVLVKGLKFEKRATDDGFFYAPYTVMANVGKVMINETVKRADDITPINMLEETTTYVYNATHQMLESVSTSNSDGIVYKTKYKYAKDFVITNPDVTKPDVVALKGLNDNFRHGELIETIQTSKEGANPAQTIGAKLTLFKNFNGKILPHISYVFPSVQGFTETSISGSPQILSIHTAYIPVSTAISYTMLGQPLSVIDNKNNKAGFHYGYGSTVPVATFSKAKAEEAVFDDFESTTSFGLEVVAGPATKVQGWTGDKALTLAATSVLRRVNIEKAANQYRFSCWVKSAGSPQLTFKAFNGALVMNTASFVYDGGGDWKYYEGTINTTTNASPFTFEINANGSAEIDDVRFLPKNASIASTTIKPLLGTTSETNDNGLSVFKEYDEQGRLLYVKDQHKNVIQVNEYRYMKETPAPLNSTFTYTHYDDYFAQTPYNFTAPVNCGSVTYSWKVNDVEVSTNAVLSHSFSGQGYFEVALTVTSNSGSVSTVRGFCVLPYTNTAMYLFCTQQNIFHCSANNFRTIKVKEITSCESIQEPDYKWYYQPSGSNTWYYIETTTVNELTFDPVPVVGQVSFVLKCVISGVCIYDDSVNDNCDNNYTYIGVEKTLPFTYVNNSPCL